MPDGHSIRTVCALVASPRPKWAMSDCSLSLAVITRSRGTTCPRTVALTKTFGQREKLWFDPVLALLVQHHRYREFLNLLDSEKVIAAIFGRATGWSVVVDEAGQRGLRS